VLRPPISPELERDIKDWVTIWNENPCPQSLGQDGRQILKSLGRSRMRIPESGHESDVGLSRLTGR